MKINYNAKNLDDIVAETAQLCDSAVEQLQSIIGNAWRVAMNGKEAIVPRMWGQFLEIHFGGTMEQLSDESIVRWVPPDNIRNIMEHKEKMKRDVSVDSLLDSFAVNTRNARWREIRENYHVITDGRNAIISDSNADSDRTLKLRIRKMFHCIPDEKIIRFLESLTWIPGGKGIITHTFPEAVFFIDTRDVNKLVDGFICEYETKGNRPGIWLTRRNYNEMKSILDCASHWDSFCELLKNKFFDGCDNIICKMEMNV